MMNSPKCKNPIAPDLKKNLGVDSRYDLRSYFRHTSVDYFLMVGQSNFNPIPVPLPSPSSKHIINLNLEVYKTNHSNLDSNINRIIYYIKALILCLVIKFDGIIL